MTHPIGEVALAAGQGNVRSPGKVTVVDAGRCLLLDLASEGPGRSGRTQGKGFETSQPSSGCPPGTW